MFKFFPVYEPTITQKEIEYVIDAIKSGWVSSIGPYVERFEQKFAEFVGTKYAISVSNGTVALHLALVTLGIKDGDEVLVPDLTFVATANAVTYCRAKPIFVDVTQNNWCIDPVDIRKKITKNTRAIIVVHLYGHPANMDEILEIAKEYNLFVIEDCAEAHGAVYKGQIVGSMGDFGTFSFYGNKIITTGEGGMLTTNSSELYERAKFLKDHAMSKDRKYYHPEIGYNYRMTNIQAALGLAQLERIEEIISKKRQIFEWYKKYLGDIDGIRLNPEEEWAKNVYWMVCMVLDKDFGITRDELMVKLREKGIDTRPFFYPMSGLPMYGGSPINPVAKYLSERGINLPSSAKLTEEEVRWIAKSIKEIIGNS